MQLNTHIRSKSAIALGALFALGTAYVLFEDVVRAGAPVTTDHVITALVLVGTIASGHYLVPVWEARRWVLSAGLSALFAAGTFICVTGSASRSAEHSAEKTAVVSSVNEARTVLADALKTAQSERSQLWRDMSSECATGRGKRCDGARSSLAFADQHIAEIERDLAAAAPARVADAGLKHAARVFAFASQLPETEIENALLLLWPFARAIVLELATIVFMGLGLGHQAKETPETKETAQETAPEIMKTLKKLGKPVTNDELARAMGVSKGHASKMVAKLSGQVTKTRQGRHVAIALLH